MANRNFANGGKMFMMEAAPVKISCNFVVDSANGNGLGIRSLKGPLVQNVFMHTSATPASGSPNPQAGVIVIQLQDNFNRILSGGHDIVSPVSGSAVKIDNSAMTVGNAYVITTLDSSITAAQWQTLGVPAGVTPAVGVAFIAKLVGLAGEANTSSARVMAPAAAGSAVMSIESIGDANLAIAPSPTANQGFGAQIIVACRNISGAIAAPVDGSVIALDFLLSNSSVQVKGE